MSWGCAHVETFPIGYGVVRCLGCGVALSVEWAPPYARRVIQEPDRSASWNEVEAAIADEQPRARPWWQRWFGDPGDPPPPPPPRDRD